MAKQRGAFDQAGMLEQRKRVQEILLEDGWALIVVSAIPDRPGVAAEIFEAVAVGGVDVDIILQNSSIDRLADISFCVREHDVDRTVLSLGPLKGRLQPKDVSVIGGLIRVVIAGTRFRSDPSYYPRVFRALADAGVNIRCIGTSSLKLTCLIEQADRERAKKALEEAFEADAAEH